MIKLNIQEKSLTSKPVLNERCPNCGTSDYWEKRTASGDEYSIFESIEDYNKCNACKTRFNDYGEEEAPHHEVKSVLIILGIMAAVAVLVVVGGIVFRFLGIK